MSLAKLPLIARAVNREPMVAVVDDATGDDVDAARNQLSAWIGGTVRFLAGLTISPAMATAMLEKNTGNRRVRRAMATRYARAMAEGQWMVTGQPIIFARDGTLNDGQHRLMACIEADVPFVCDVRFGVERAAFVAIDIGGKRTNGDVLTIAGETETNLLAAAVALKFRHDRSDTGTISSQGIHPSPADTLAVLAANPGLRDAIAPARHVYGAGVRMRPAVLVWLAYEFRRRDAAGAEKFLGQIASGAGLNKGAPALTFRNKMIRVSESRESDPSGYLQAAWLIKAWNRFRAGKTIDVIAWNPKTERFPEIM